ncbi:MAG: hypothetical protein IIC61_11365 [Proteobacteria bacterium]|nr:hypothetical protein [Pseudomonadota bacterium]TDJ34390.1 MAG: hypothetical protein E2O53_08265 [Gammaproteobacteria bacterium]
MNEQSAKHFLDNPTLYEGTCLAFQGFKLTEWKEGFARMEMTVRPEHRNTIGYLSLPRPNCMTPNTAGFVPLHPALTSARNVSPDCRAADQAKG